MAVRLEDRKHTRLVENPQEIARRFERSAEIKNMGEFQEALVALFAEQEQSRHGQDEEVSTEIKRHADKLVLDEPWRPTDSQLEQGRVAVLKELARPENLSVAEFALLAGKSRAQIYNDIKARRYLAVSRGGPRGARLPDFQLRDEGQALVQLLLEKAPDIDGWTWYTILAEPNDAIDGDVPGYSVQRKNVKQLAALLLGQLGFVGEARQLG